MPANKGTKQLGFDTKRKPLTLKEYEALSPEQRMKLYDKVAKKEGAATGQTQTGGRYVPPDMQSRLTSKPYTDRGRNLDSIANTRAVSDKEIRQGQAREMKLKRWMKENPNQPLPPNWEKEMSKGSKVLNSSGTGYGSYRNK